MRPTSTVNCEQGGGLAGSVKHLQGLPATGQHTEPTMPSRWPVVMLRVLSSTHSVEAASGPPAAASAS